MSASYSDSDSELNDVSEAHDTKWYTAHATMTADEINEYLEG